MEFITDDDAVDEICDRVMDIIEKDPPGPAAAALAIIIGKICAASEVDPQVIYTLLEAAYKESVKEMGKANDPGALN